MKSTIIVTGANGQLGRSLRELESSNKNYKFIFTDVEELDITNESAIEQFFSDNRPNWVVNCASYTAVDKAESERELAMLINSKAVEYLAIQSKKVSAPLIHISTDYVFDGKASSILTEDMKCNPINVYGQSKLAGEESVKLNPAHVILRTSWLYSPYGANFVKTMQKLGRERAEISVVGDQWGSPTSAIDLARAIISVIDAGEKGEDVVGIYHYSNEGATCWADFAEQIMMLSSIECRVNPITSDEYPTAAVRPQFTVMSKNKFKNKFNVVIPEWESSLEEVISKL